VSAGKRGLPFERVEVDLKRLHAQFGNAE
jgi:hypothetical protein